jgi:hypothetical protein
VRTRQATHATFLALVRLNQWQPEACRTTSTATQSYRLVMGKVKKTASGTAGDRFASYLSAPTTVTILFGNLIIHQTALHSVLTLSLHIRASLVQLLEGNSSYVPHDALFHYCSSRLMAIRYGPYKLRAFVQGVSEHSKISQSSGERASHGQILARSYPFFLAPHGGQLSRKLPCRQPQRRILYKLELLWLGCVGYGWTRRMQLPFVLFPPCYRSL